MNIDPATNAKPLLPSALRGAMCTGLLCASMIATLAAPAWSQIRTGSHAEAFIGTFLPHGLDGREYVDQHIPMFQSAMLPCYERALSATPTLAGMVVLRVFVASAGDVTDVQVIDNRTGNAAMAQCIETSMETLRLAPNNHDDVSITLPVSFIVRDASGAVSRH